MKLKSVPALVGYCIEALVTMGIWIANVVLEHGRQTSGEEERRRMPMERRLVSVLSIRIGP